MSAWQMTIVALGVLFLAPFYVYLLARVVFAAYFLTKLEWRDRK